MLWSGHHAPCPGDAGHPPRHSPQGAAAASVRRFAPRGPAPLPRAAPRHQGASTASPRHRGKTTPGSARIDHSGLLRLARGASQGTAPAAPPERKAAGGGCQQVTRTRISVTESSASSTRWAVTGAASVDRYRLMARRGSPAVRPSRPDAKQPGSSTTSAHGCSPASRWMRTV
jgi:hypothetical protein